MEGAGTIEGPLSRVLGHMERHSLGGKQSGRAFRSRAPRRAVAREDEGAESEGMREMALDLLSEKLLEDAKWCWANPVLPVVDGMTVGGLEFYRNFVMKNTPCLIKGLPVCSWSEGWTWDDFIVRSGGASREVRVNTTPNGRGDSVVCSDDGELLFVQPEEVKVPMGAFVQWVSGGEYRAAEKLPPGISESDVLYLSAQNDSLREEFMQLLENGFSDVRFGDTIFGKSPDAINLWIGNEKSVSTMHRDVTYENIYSVLKGTKVFHLLPPCCGAFVSENLRHNASYKKAGEENSSWAIEKGEGRTPWIAVDLADRFEERGSGLCHTRNPFGNGVDHENEELAQELEQIERYEPNLRSLLLRVEVHAGESLYLPAGWFHRVTQTEPTIAVNRWYDRDFNAVWALNEAIESLVDAVSFKE